MAGTDDVHSVDLRGLDGLRLRADEFGDPDRRRWCCSTVAGRPASPGVRPRACSPNGVGTSTASTCAATARATGPTTATTAPRPSPATCTRSPRRSPQPPVLVGASLGGIASMVAIGTHDEPVARGLVLVDVAPKIEQDGAMRIGAFMSEHLEDGFGSLDEVADAVAAYNPHRPRPDRPVRAEEERAPARRRPVGVALGPALHAGQARLARRDRARRSCTKAGCRTRPRNITIPTLLVRGRVSDLLSEEGAQDLLRLVPHAEYVDVEGAGHMVAGDKNDLFNDAIVELPRPPQVGDPPDRSCVKVAAIWPLL